MKSCSLTDGLIAAANKNRIIDTLIHPAIVLHNELMNGVIHQLDRITKSALTFDRTQAQQMVRHA